MAADVGQTFIEFSIKKLQQHTSEIDRCLAQLSEEQVWARGSDNENAIGNLVLHLCGNVGQRVTAFSGRPDLRVRAAEFAARGGTGVPELAERIDSIVDQVVGELQKVTTARLTDLVAFGEFRYTILEATYHMVEHFALHTGQIIFATKSLTGRNLGFYQPAAPPKP